jgi:hypothetical protein
MYAVTRVETVLSEVTGSARSFRQGLGLAAIATLAFAGSLAPAWAANHEGSSIMTMKQDLADQEKNIHSPEGFDPSLARCSEPVSAKSCGVIDSLGSAHLHT